MRPYYDQNIVYMNMFIILITPSPQNDCECPPSQYIFGPLLSLPQIHFSKPLYKKDLGQWVGAVATEHRGEFLGQGVHSYYRQHVFNVLGRCVLFVCLLVSPNLCSIIVIKTNRWVQKLLKVQSCLVNRCTLVLNFICCRRFPLNTALQ